MRVPAQRVVEWLTDSGEMETAFEVEGAVPPLVDTDVADQREMLVRAGVDVDALEATLGT